MASVGSPLRFAARRVEAILSNHRYTQPAIVIPGGSVQKLKRLPRVHDRFDESSLQDFCFEAQRAAFKGPGSGSG